MSSKTPFIGSCLCSQIKYQVTKIESRMGHCHCTMCQKFHGAAFATFGEAKVENFKWIEGKELLKSYFGNNGTERKFCSHCGSSLIFVPSNDNGELIEFSLGTLDSAIDLKPDVHIFTESKACWFEISDDLPQYLKSRN
ncbi:MAG: GFA family protein [Marinicellaceae bacterium]